MSALIAARLALRTRLGRLVLRKAGFSFLDVEAEQRRLIEEARKIALGYFTKATGIAFAIQPPTVLPKLSVEVRDTVTPTLRALQGALGKAGMARVCNTAATAALKASQQAINRAVDRPTTFTQRAVAVERATSSRPYARVGVQFIQAQYLQHLLGVGPSTVRRSVPFPAGGVARLNQYGNLPRNKLKTLLARPDTFYGTVRTRRGPVTGVWQRGSRGNRFTGQFTKSKGEFKRTRRGGAGRDLRLVAALEPRVRYTKQLDFLQVALGAARPALDAAIRAEMAKALGRR